MALDGGEVMVKPPALGTCGTNTSSHCPGRNCDVLECAAIVGVVRGNYPYCVSPGNFKTIYADIVIDLVYSFQGNLVQQLRGF